MNAWGLRPRDWYEEPREDRALMRAWSTAHALIQRMYEYDVSKKREAEANRKAKNARHRGGK